jgi:RPA family protein
MLFTSMEGAARVFAGDFNRSTLSEPGDEAADLRWIVTPGGAWCRRVFLAGALTEVTEGGDMLRCRIADPTGTFDLVLGGRNTKVAERIRKFPLPSFVSVIGQAMLFQKNADIVLFIRPEQVRLIDRTVRDQWVITTAISTLVRLNHMQLAMRGTRMDERVNTVLRHYNISDTGILEIVTMVEAAVMSVRPYSSQKAPEQPDARALVRKYLQDESEPRGIAVNTIIERAVAQGVSSESVLAAIESLIHDDECYQPQKGFIKLL